MKRLFGLLMGVGLLTITTIGCQHTAGACDCIHPTGDACTSGVGSYGSHPLFHGGSQGTVIHGGAVAPSAPMPMAPAGPEQLPTPTPQNY